MYHQAKLKREESELTQRIYKEQLNNTTPGDFVELLAKDFELINVQKNDEEITNTNTAQYKKLIKKQIKAAAFNYLRDIQEKHTKIRHIEYKKLEVQKYMTSPIFTNNEVNLLHALRSRSTECKVSYKQKYVSSNLLCSLCKIEHILTCKVLTQKYQIK